MELRIKNTFAQLGIDTKPAYLMISQGKTSLNVSKDEGHLGLRAKLGTLKVDGTLSREDIGLYTPMGIGHHYYGSYWDHGLKAIGEMAQDGDYLAMIERGHTISELVKRKTAPLIKEVQIAFRRGAEIEYEPGGVSFDPKVGKVMIDVKPFRPQKTYYPGSISTYLLEKGGVQIQVKGSRLDTVV